ncbi:phage tail tape measure protein [Rhodoplanes sp. TEM]|uniref:Phage tail tape measure protein n=1 Tax=Rhodoplanes tepidamans TaxID=200616 RepID=A0ABT5JGS5_RHOTP|nr:MULTISPECIES: phage tail tape measure protein [Rhodoplanes]MDC7788693.1 phage tail tape measure protein [Rhodoplanes tepidamans]MDC7987619.1 phage tail tape measure protein [Rhodoplanes sp. TEM]MDQ0358303.1 phage-related minor tail protein [Rhodoplanes tepidamans]
MAEDPGCDCMADGEMFDEADEKSKTLIQRLLDMQINAKAFSRTMTDALAGAVSGSKRLDDALKSIVLRLSDLTLKAALTPLTNELAGGLNRLLENSTAGASASLSSLLGVAAAGGAVKPFAAGGVIGTPTYFPLASGGLGLAGEAGPEAIVPLARTADGRLGIAGGGSGATHVTVNIAAQDVASFRGSEAYLTGRIARAVARGRRGL